MAYVVVRSRAGHGAWKLKQLGLGSQSRTCQQHLSSLSEDTGWVNARVISFKKLYDDSNLRQLAAQTC